MFFSPALSPCLEAAKPFATALEQVRQRGVKLVVLTLQDPIGKAFADGHPFLRTLSHDYRPLMAFNGMAVFDLDALSPFRR